MNTKAFIGSGLAIALGAMSNNTFAFDDFNGLIESRPDDGIGAGSLVGGRSMPRSARSSMIMMGRSKSARASKSIYTTAGLRK